MKTKTSKRINKNKILILHLPAKIKQNDPKILNKLYNKSFCMVLKFILSCLCDS